MDVLCDNNQEDIEDHVYFVHEDYLNKNAFKKKYLSHYIDTHWSLLT